MNHRARTRSPRPTSHPVLAGAGGLWSGAAAAAGLTVALGTRLAALARAAGPLQVDGLVELGVLVAGVAVLSWLAVSCAVAGGCLTARAAGGGWRRGEAWVHRWAPVVVQRAVVLAVGAGLGLSAATGASASDAGLPAPSPAPSLSATVLADAPAATDLGWAPTSAVPSSTPTAPAGGSGSLPSAPVRADDAPAPTVVPTPPAPGSTPSTRGAEARTSAVGPTTIPANATRSSSVAGAGSTASGTTSRTVTVEPGDTLWAIAARHLPAGADDAQVAAAWPAWYRANLGTIGDEPDLIRPGQLLIVPGAETGATS